MEENIGDNADRDGFFWSYLGSSGDPGGAALAAELGVVRTQGVG
jgi:hypothetical protein